MFHCFVPVYCWRRWHCWKPWSKLTQLYVTCCCRHCSVSLQDDHMYDGITNWLAANRLVLNQRKTDLGWCSTSRCTPNMSTTPGSAIVVSTKDIRDLGVIYSLLCLWSIMSTSWLDDAMPTSAASHNVDMLWHWTLLPQWCHFCNTWACSKKLLDKVQRVNELCC